MKVRARALVGAAVLAVSAFAGGQPSPVPQTPVDAASESTTTGAQPAVIDRGRYLVEVGDCVACHTQKGGARFAGGRPVETPFGVVLSANLTPDDETGIGRYTAELFYRALHEGIDREGHHLYPAFPYNYYTNVSREDTDAMFAYLRSVPPQHNALERNRLPFPFNVRAFVGVWNALYLERGPYRADASKSARWNRGAYLVEGLGHCEACHTPRNLLGGPKQGEAFEGGSFGGWFAPDITANRRTGIGHWGDDELSEFLHRGQNVHSAASGEMGEVVAFSTSQMNDADVAAVIEYLRGQPASPVADASVPDAVVMKQGRAIWQDECAACHQMDAQGVPRVFPPLKGDANAQQRDPTTMLHFILAGTRRVPTAAAPTALAMPAFHWKLDDEQVAAVATFVRNSWGNAAAPVEPEVVARLRRQLKLDVAWPSDEVARDMSQPGPNTLSAAGTDSRDNGTASAGRAAAPDAAGAVAAASAPIPSIAAAHASAPRPP